MRVLVFTPGLRLEPETVRAVLGQELPAGVVADFVFTRDNPFPPGDMANVLYSYQKARRLVLTEGHDALWTVESDIIPPPNAMSALLSLPADVAHGLYCFRLGAPVWSACRWAITGDHYSDSSLTFFPGEMWKAWGQVIRVTGLGLGCCLIRRRVLEAVDFRPGPNNTACDTSFARDVNAAQFLQLCDTRVRCGHKRPDGIIIWPDAEKGGHFQKTLEAPLWPTPRSTT